MSQFIAETSIKNGSITLHKLPFKDNTKVQVVLIPKVSMAKMSFGKVRKLTKNITGSLSDDMIAERKKR